MDANKVRYGYAEEAVYGTIPNSAAFQLIRYTGGNGWTPSDTTTGPDEVRADLMKARPVVTQRAADGGVDFALSYSQQFFDWIPMAMSSDGANLAAAWTTPAVLSASTINVVQDGSDWTFQAVSPALASINTLVEDQYIMTTGFTNAANNGTFRVKAVDFASDPQVITVYGTLVAETGDADERIAISAMARNGVARHSVSVVDSRPGVDTYQSFFGQVVDSLSLSFQANALVTGSVGFIGAGYSPSAYDVDNASNTLGNDGATVTGASYTASESTTVMQTAENIAVYTNNSLNGGLSCTRGFDISISGRARAQQCLNYMYNSGVGLNSFSPELNLTYYFTDKTILDQYLSMGETTGYSEQVTVSDPSGNTYIIMCPAVFLGGWSLTAGSLDADMEASFGTSTAYVYTNTSGDSFAMQVDRFPAGVFA